MPSRSRRAFKAVAVDGRALRQSTPFRRLFLGQFISMVGRQITIVAVPYQVYQATHSPVLLGLIGLVQVVPSVAVSLFAGSIADTMDRRRLLLITQSCLALCSGLLVLGAWWGNPPVIYLYAVVALAAAFSAIDSPTRTAMVPNLVAPEQLAGALSLNFGLFQATMIAGPAVAGLILGHGGLMLAYSLDVVSFAAAFIAIYLLPPQRPAPTAVKEKRIEAMVRGFAFVRRQPVILGGYALDLVAMIFGLPQALFPVLAAQTFHVTANSLGLLYAAPGVGAVLAAATAGWVGRARRQGRVVVICVAVWGAAIVLFGITSNFWLALGFLAVAGAADSFSAVARNTMMQVLTPDALRGRLTAVYYMVVTGGPRLGDLEAGAVASVWTPRISVISGGVLCLLGVAVAALTLPAVWSYRAASTVGGGSSEGD